MLKFKGKGNGREEAPRRRPRLMQGHEGYTFRRSRTLTGSLSNQVNSSGTARPDMVSERVKLHRLSRHSRHLKAGLGFVLLLVLAAGFLVANNVLFTQKRYAAEAIPEAKQVQLSQSILNYTNRYPAQAFLVNLDDERLKRFMQTDHPEVAAVVVENRWLPGAARIDVRFREPIAVWQVAGQRYYVDANGVAFANLYGGKQPALKVEDASGFTPEDDDVESIASRVFISYLGQLLGALKADKVGQVERVVIPQSIRQLNVYVRGYPYPIYAHTDRNPYSQSKDIKNALTFFKQKGIQPEYIDVRVEGKAFYK